MLLCHSYKSIQRYMPRRRAAKVSAVFSIASEEEGGGGMLLLFSSKMKIEHVDSLEVQRDWDRLRTG